MKRIAMYLAAFGSALLTVGGAAWAQMAAPGQMGNYCATPTKTCMLSHGSLIGRGCSCRAPGGRERGKVASSYGYWGWGYYGYPYYGYAYGWHYGYNYPYGFAPAPVATALRGFLCFPPLYILFCV
jgi:hypothetical protein